MTGEQAAAMNAAIRLIVYDDIAVFPVQRNKCPACPQGFKAAVREMDALKDLWHRYPGVLVGTPTGIINNMTVLDLDLQHDEARSWSEEKGGMLPPTFRVRTRSGGEHLLYQHQRGVGCSASRIAPHVDTRSDGGYIVWWAAAGLPVLDDRPLAAWPDWLVPPTPPDPPPVRELVMPTTARLAGLVRTIASATEGERNRLLYWCACRAGESVATGLLSEGAAVAMLVQAANACGLDQVSATKTAISGVRKGGMG